MPELTGADVIREFKERVARGETDGISVVYRIAGGLPAKQYVHKELCISSDGQAHVQAEGIARQSEELSTALPNTEIQVLFRQLGECVDELLPRSETWFIPDSLVGSVTIEVDGGQATLFFLADEEARQAQHKPISTGAAATFDSFSRLTRRLLGEQG